MSNLIERCSYRVKALLRYIRSIANLKIIYGISLAKLSRYSNIDFTIDKIDRKLLLN